MHGGGDYLTIQEGIDAADVGDTVRVASGRYAGPLNRNLSCPGKWIVLDSEAGADSTIIDCEHEGRAVYLISGESIRLRGFTVTNGSGSGGGARIVNSSLEARECVFRENDGGDYGGALFCNNAISGSAWFTQCVFADNEAAVSGGAVRLDFAHAHFDSCTFESNRAPEGSAIDCGTFSSTDIAHTILANGEGGAPIHCPASSAPGIWRSCVFGNAGGDSLCGDYYDNIFVDPLFCEGDLTLHDDAPCLPSGNPWGEQLGAYGAGGCGPSTGVSTQDGSLGFALHAPSPNPFEAATTIAFRLPEPADVTIRIFDVSGRLVRTLLTDAHRQAGRHEVRWDGRDDSGEPVASGVYFCRAEVGGASATKRLVRLR